MLSAGNLSFPLDVREKEKERREEKSEK